MNLSGNKAINCFIAAQNTQARELKKMNTETIVFGILMRAKLKSIIRLLFTKTQNTKYLWFQIRLLLY